MNQNFLLDLYNSATFFGLLAAIAIGVWVLVLQKSSKEKSSKR